MMDMVGFYKTINGYIKDVGYFTMMGRDSVASRMADLATALVIDFNKNNAITNDEAVKIISKIHEATELTA